MGERLDESPPVERTPLLERTENSKLSSEAYLYLASERPAAPATLPAEFPTFVREPDGSFKFSVQHDGSDTLRSTDRAQALIQMNEAGDLDRLTVKLDGNSEVQFELRDLINPKGPFRDGEHGTRKIDEHGTVRYTSPDGQLKIVIDKCGKVLSIDSPDNSYHPSPRRLGESACNS